MSTPVMDGVTWEGLQREATAVVASASQAGVMVRAVGSAGIRMHCSDAAALMDEIDRVAKDIDLVVRAGDREKLRSLLSERGYEIDRDLLVAMEGHRFAFRHPASNVEIDVFVEKLEFCHTIELGDRWALHPSTVSVEDLLLQKLQVHEPTQCDLIDTAVVLATHPLGGGEPEEIDTRYVAGLLARDWGFHRDACLNLARLKEALGREVQLPAGRIAPAKDGAAGLAEAIDEAKKSIAWRARARVGERMQWWEDVDERSDTY